MRRQCDFMPPSVPNARSVLRLAQDEWLTYILRLAQGEGTWRVRWFSGGGSLNLTQLRQHIAAVALDERELVGSRAVEHKVVEAEIDVLPGVADVFSRVRRDAKLLTNCVAANEGAVLGGFRGGADAFLAGIMDACVDANNKIGSTTTPETPTKDNAYEYLVDLGVMLDEDDVPLEGRFVIVPAWFHGLLLKDERFVKAGTTMSDRALSNGEVGEAAGFSILKSNNVPNTSGTKYKLIAGHRMATAYAEQIVDLQTYKPEKRFGDAVKGLHVYGAKVVRPTALACLIANKS